MAVTITSTADKEVTVILANANKQSEIMKGEGDGERNKIFAEAFLTFLVVWMIEISGLWLLAGGAPSLEMPTIDADNVSLGTILYGLGLFGSIVVMLGMIPYTIEASIKKS